MKLLLFLSTCCSKSLHGFRPGHKHQGPAPSSGPRRGEGRRPGGAAELGENVDPCASPPRCGQKATFGEPESRHPACNPLAVPPVQQSIRDGRAGVGSCSCSAAAAGASSPRPPPSLHLLSLLSSCGGFCASTSYQCDHCWAEPPPTFAPSACTPAGPAPSDPQGPRSRWG